MELKFSKIVSKKKSIIDMYVYGMMGLYDKDGGDNFNGHDFAREFKWVDEYHDEINCHINSEGGSMMHGLSVVSAIMDATAKVTTVNDGVCASMAAVILMAGDVVKAKDYSKLMFHSPYYVDEKGEKINNLGTKERKGLKMMRDTLIRLLMKRGKSEDEAKAIIGTADKWYTPEEALAEGLIDEIVQTGRKELAALEPAKLVAALKNERETLNTNKSMKQVIAKLNGFGMQLNEDADETQVVAALDKIDPSKKSGVDQKVIDKLLAVGKKTGVVTDGENGNHERFRKLANADFDLFVDMLNIDQVVVDDKHEKPQTQARMSEMVAAAGGGKKPAADEKTFDWYEQNAPEVLAKMEANEPERFAKLQAADNAKYV